ncbi:MAG: hypothetical protein OEZ65_14875, partial [Gemmatimonadota bacterium]|nr:hypothetical protein [Gemmatimonadota bacterium]
MIGRPAGSGASTLPVARTLTTYRAGILLLAAALLPGALQGQTATLSGYALGMESHAGTSTLTAGGRNFLRRIRIMPGLGWTHLSVDAAGDFVVRNGGGFAFTGEAERSTFRGDWLDLDGTLWNGSGSVGTYRLDRLHATVDAGRVEVTVGRQPISWGTTLVLSVADPFSPFDPSDPFREYRTGVDAVRVRVFPGPFTEIEAVVRPVTTPSGSVLHTALLRGQTSLAGWALGGWAGILHDEAAAAAFLSGSWGATAVRGEASLRPHPRGGTAVRTALGVDRRFSPGGRDLYVILEYMHDGFGVGNVSNLLELVYSKPFNRNEMQTMGSNVSVAQASLQLHPLVGVDALVLTNLNDGSALVGPGLTW